MLNYQKKSFIFIFLDIFVYILNYREESKKYQLESKISRPVTLFQYKYYNEQIPLNLSTFQIDNSLIFYFFIDIIIHLFI